MKAPLGLSILMMLLFAAGAFGQGGVDPYTFQSLTYGPTSAPCTGTPQLPLPEGTIGYLYLDANSNGPDASDPIAPLCADPANNCPTGPALTWNYNQVLINGDAMLGIPGAFYFDGYMNIVGTNLVPNRIYLTFYYPNIATWNTVGGVKWTSPIFQVGADFASIDVELNGWTCTSGNATFKVSGLIASTDHCAAIDLLWNDVAGETSYQVYRNHLLIATTAANDTDYVDRDLSVADFHYYIVARIGEVPGIPSDSVNGAHWSVIANVPGFTATDGKCDSTVITWADVELETGYQVWRANPDGSGNTILTPVPLPPNTVEYTDLSGESGLLYRYSIAATNVCGAGPPTSQDMGFRVTTIVAPADFAATDGDFCAQTHLVWEDTPEEAFYKILRRSAESTDTIATVPANVTEYNDSTGLSGVVYEYAVIAMNECGAATSAFDSGYRTGRTLMVPETVAASSNQCGRVWVVWWYTNGAGIDSFIVRRDGVRVGTVAVPGPAGKQSFTHFTADRLPGLYTVCALSNDCGEGQPSVEAEGVALQAPETVSQVTATDGWCDSTVITWTDVLTETNYEVWRANADGSGNKNLTPGGLAANTVHYEDGSATPGFVYQYTVVAQNACGASVPSLADDGLRLQEPHPPADVAASDGAFCDYVTVTWADMAVELNYIVLRQNGVTLDTLAILAANTTAYNDATAEPGTVYEYAVIAQNPCGAATSAFTPGSRKTIPGGVSGLSVSGGTSCTVVVIEWSDTGSETGYRIYRNGAAIGTVAANTTRFEDGGPLTPGERYGYSVLAFNACGDGARSAVDTGFTHTVPPQVTGVAIPDTSCTEIRIFWTPVADAGHYAVYRDNMFLTTVDDSSMEQGYADAAASPGNHVYSIAAVNICGEGQWSVAVTGFRTTVPAVAEGFTAGDGVSCACVPLQWQDGGTETAYRVLRMRGGHTDTLATLPANAIAFNDSSATGGVVYSYAVQGVNVCGASANAVDNGFIATPPTVIPASVVASSNQCGRVWVAWTYGSSAGVDSFVVKRDGVRLGAVRVPAAQGTQSFTHWTSAQEPGQYTVTAMNILCGEGQPSIPTQGKALQAPEAVGNVAATDGQCDSLVVTWSDVTTETKYEVWRASADGSGSTNLTPGGLAANTLRYRDPSAVPGIVYRYTLLARNNCGASPVSEFDEGLWFATPTAPTAVVAADSAFCDYVAVSWVNTAPDVHCMVLRYGTNGVDTLATLPAAVTSFNDSTAVPGVSYDYAVMAVNTCGAALSASDAGSRKTVPMKVAGLTATDGTPCERIVLQWGDVISETGYRIYRNGEAIATTTADDTTFTDSSALVPGIAYGFQVLAFNACGDGEGSSVDTGFTRSAPEAVTGVVASDSSCSVIRVTWSDVPGDTAYHILRDGQPVGSTAASVTEFIDEAAPLGASSYRVIALNGCGAAAPSDAAMGERLQVPGVVSGLSASSGQCDSTIVTWIDLTTESAYHVLRAHADGTGEIDLTPDGLPGNTERYSDASGALWVIYRYSVRADNSCGSGDLSAHAFGQRIQGPTPPANVAASDSAFCTHVALSWVDDSTETAYRIVRFGESEQTDTLANLPPNTTTYNDSTALPGIVYDYQVIAVNACGEVRGGVDSGSRIAPLARVTGLSATSLSCVGVALRWQDIRGEESYAVWRSTPDGGGVIRVGTLPADSIYFIDTSGERDLAYRYWIVAADSCSSSPASEFVLGWQSAYQPRSGLLGPGVINLDCGIAVEPNDTLIIMPGTTLNFTQPVGLDVQGVLIAVGTAEDSIIFTCDTLANPMRWSGVRLSVATGVSEVAYCEFRYGSCTATDVFQTGGAISCMYSGLVVRRCTFTDNRAQWGGAILMNLAAAGTRIDSCVFVRNRSLTVDGAGAGGAVTIWHNPVPISRCLFLGNSAGIGGAIEVTSTTSTVTQCTFAGNTATDEGAIGYSWAGHQQYNSCIFSENSYAPLFQLDGGSTADVHYSCIADMAGGFANTPGPAGFGVVSQLNYNEEGVDAYFNVFRDPGFADNTEYSLRWNSPAVDAGDPALPPDAEDDACRSRLEVLFPTDAEQQSG